MDSFDAANQLLQMLRSLSPQLQHLSKAVYFALKNSDKEDYLLPTILDVINDKQLPTSIKANILQFVDLLINESLSLDKYKQAYVQGLKDNLPLIITQVTDNKSNLYSTYLSLFNISQHFKMDCHGFVSQFDSNMLTDKDIDLIKRNEEFTKSDINDDEPLVRAWKILLQCKHECQFERAKLLEHSEYIDDIVDEDLLFSIREKSNPSTILLSKRQILVRMEDDREAHKRSKENFWVVNRDKEKGNHITEDEFVNHYWNKFQPLNDQENKEFLNSLQELNVIVENSYKDKY